MAAMIELDAVTKQFAGKRDVVALDAVTLTIPRGEMVSIIGPSGSGKSTLLNLVGGLDRPTAGHVSIDGERLSGLDDDALTRVRRDKIGFIFQFFNLLPTLSCVENVGLPLHPRGCPRNKGDEAARGLLPHVQPRRRLAPVADTPCHARTTPRPTPPPRPASPPPPTPAPRQWRWSPQGPALPPPYLGGPSSASSSR